MIKTNCPKLVKNSIIPAIALLLLVPGIVNAATDSTINFQGKIVRNDTGYEGLNVTAGNPSCVVDGNGNDTCDFQVKYYSASSGGTLLLTEVFTNVEIGQYNGAFTLSLGSDGSPTAGTYASCEGGTCDNLQEVVNAVSDLYVELGFAPGGAGSYTETFSRMPIQASAYALKAKYAEKASTAFQFDTAANSSGYASPSEGMVYYDTTDDELKVYDGSTWGSLGGGSGSLFTDSGIFTYLTALTDHFVLGSSSYTAIGADSYTTYLSGLGSRAPFSFDMTAKRLTLSGDQAQSGLTVYSDYNSTGAWPVVSMKAEGSNFDNVVLQVVQDGTGNMLSLQKGSTEAFIFENPLTFYIHPRTDAPTTYTNRLYNVNGSLYWNGSVLGAGSDLWTDGGTFTYLTSTADDVIIGGDSDANAKFFFDVSTGNLGIGTSTPGAKLDIAGSSSTISNTTGDITMTPDESVVIKANDTAADNLMEWQDSSSTVLGLINQNGYATFGGSTSNTSAIVTLGASSSGVAQLNFASGFDVSAPNTGDLWWNGTNLYFYDGSESVDLLTSGGGSDVLSSYGTTSNTGYLNVQHDTNSYDVVASGWICVDGTGNASCTGGTWKNITEADYTITQSLSNQWNDADADGIIRTAVESTYISLTTDNLTWRKYDNTAPTASNTTGTNGRIPIGTSGGDITYTNTPSVIKDGDTYKMWYAGSDGTNYRIYYATSPDGLTWTKYDNTVPTASNTTGTNGRIPLGTSGGDTTHTYAPSVIKDGDIYKMWYSGYASSWRIYYATSPDGLTWTKYDNTVLAASNTTGTNGRIPNGTSGGDTSATYVANVIKDGTTYRMWYTGYDGTNWRIYYATSPDGLTWAKYDNAVPTASNTKGTNGRIPLGTTGADASASWLPSVIKDGDMYKMWYTGYDGTNYRILYATSPDGLTWAKYDNTVPTASDTIGTNGRIPLGSSGADTTHVYRPMVIKDGTTYRMWFVGSNGTNRIYYATSSSPYGIYNSPVISTPNAQSYDALKWESNLNTYGKISVQTRSGNTDDPTNPTDSFVWTKYDNTVETPSDTTGTNGRVPAGTSGKGDEGIYEPFVLKDEDTYKMWYTGEDGDGNYNIFYATSSDGLTWTKYDNTVPSASDTTSTNGRIPLGTSGKGDEIEVGGPTVIKDGSTYKMWYSGRDDVDGIYRVYYATSSDGLTWTKYDNTIPSASDTTGTNGRIPAGTSGKGDDWGIYNPYVLKDGSTYKMWYVGIDGYSEYRVYYATSPDGLTWTKYDNTVPSASDTTSTNGRLPLGTSGKGDEYSIYDISVLNDGDTYKMWYLGGGGYSYTLSIYYATSPDGLTWTKYDNAIEGASDTTGTNGRIPVGTSGRGDEYGMGGVGVIEEDESYKMWYAAGWGSYYATGIETIGIWEEWRPYTSGTNYTTVESGDTHTNWTGTNATVAEGDIGRDVDYFEDEDETVVTNLTKVTSSTNGGYMEATVGTINLSNYDYLTLWVRASQTGAVLRIGMGESAATEQYEDITIDVADTWQKVYWDLSDITGTSRDAITKVRLTNFSTSSNVIYLDNVSGESLLDDGSGNVVTSTPNNYFQYRVIFTTTNPSFAPQLENISLAYNSGYRIVMYDANNTRLYNYSGVSRYLRLDVVASTGGSGGGGGFVNGLAVSHVEDGTDAIAFQFDTSVTFSDPTSKLLSVLNNGTEMMFLDSDGNLYVSGTITSGNGIGVALLNNSGGTVTTRSLVTVDTTANNAFTTTTVAGMQGAMGVVQGVKVGGDLDSDGVCDSGDTCLVVFEGTTNVNLDNASSSAVGDYIYSSTTASQGHADDSTEQTNGLVGIVTSIANAGSGYVQMVFDAQNKVTADLYLNLNIGIDKNAYRDMYNQLANDYASMTDAERRGVVESNQSQSVMFDSFVDSLKMDSSTSTVGVDGDAQKAGLWGGLTIDGTTTDIAANRYLGSSTATLLVSKYYDRTQTGLQDQDSTPETLVDLGIDPNWYNGVSLQTATNLSPSYNGSLITVSGLYGTGSEHGYIDLTVTGTTVSGLTANITSSDGSCTATGASLTFGSSYSFGAGSCSGSTITIKPIRGDYNSGDRFRIASWYLEPTTTDDRGSERTFPQRSLIVASRDASNGYLTIVNADTQRVWMKFTQSSTGEMFGVASNSTMSSIAMINGELSVGMNGSSATGMYSLQFHNDNVFKYNTSGKNLSNKVISDRNVANTYAVVNSNQALVSNIVNDVSSNVVWNKPTEETTVSGWGYIVGNGGNNISEAVYLPYKFNNTPTVNVSYAASKSTTAPSSLAECTDASFQAEAHPKSITSTGFTAFMGQTAALTFSSSAYYCYTWTATGQVSPKMAAAVAQGASGVDGATTVINKSDQSSANYLVGSQNTDVIWQSKVKIDSKGNMYSAWSDDTTGTSYLMVYYGVLTRPTESSLVAYMSGAYRVGGANHWSTSGPVIAGLSSPSNQIQNIYIAEETSTIDEKSNTIYVGTSYGVSVIQEKQSGNATLYDGSDEKNGTVQYYTKDYISEKMVGDIRGMWPLNYDNTSADNEDISIKANALTAVNIDSNDAVSGVRGKAVDFNGTDEYLYRADDSDLEAMSALTLGAWVKKTSSSNGVIMGKYNSGVIGAYHLDINASGNVYFVTSSSSGYNTSLSNGTVSLNEWHFISAVYDGTSNYIYIDGQLDKVVTVSNPGAIKDTAESFAVGAYYASGSPSTYFTGSIDEPFVIATALTANQIKLQYEEGLRALKGSHSTADTYNQLNGTSNDVRSILVSPDNKNMYVGTEGGGISKIDITSSTRVNTYTTSTDPLTSTNSIETLSGRYYPILSGDIGSSGRLMGLDSEGNDSTGIYYSRTVTFDSVSNMAYLWMSANIDSSDTSSSITVSASNDGGSNYVTGTLVKTNTTGSIPEYEYSFSFPSSDDQYKVKFEIARGSSNKAATYVTKWGLAQMDISDGTVNGLFTQSSDSVADGSYLEVVHGQNTYDLVASGWVFDEELDEWVEVSDSDSGITQNLSNQWNDADAGGIIRTVVGSSDISLTGDGLTWTKYDNTVPTASNTSGTNGRIPIGTSGGDTTHAYTPTVIKDGDVYKMWYSGSDGTNFRIFYATSPDGLTWTKYDNSIPTASNTTGTNGRIPLGTSGGDTIQAANPSVIKDGDTYKMWYSGYDGTNYRIFYATSSDGLTWTKYDNTVLAASNTTGTNGRIPLGTSGGDTTGVYASTVIKDGSTYKMWYSGTNGSNARTFYATSLDGLTWTKYDNTAPTASNTTGTNGRIPVGSSGGDTLHAYTPTVIKDGDTYKMWYSGYNATYLTYYATSPDGLTWTKYDNSIPTTSSTTGTNGRIPLGTSGGDATRAFFPTVIKDGDVYKMWYSGHDGTNMRIYYATSSYSYGIYNSPVISTPNAQSYDSIRWDSELNTYGKISVQTRSGPTDDTAATGFAWSKYDNTIPSNSDTTSTNGRVPLGTSGKGDSAGILYESVILDDGVYKMWYSGYDGTNYRIYYATSTDGLIWTKYDNTIPSASDTTSTNGRIPLGTSGKGDSSHVSAPLVIKDGTTYKMWYQGHDGTNYRTYYATSSDGLTWTKYDNTIPSASDTTSTNGRLPLGTSGKGDSSGVSSPSVIKEGTTYKMWYTGFDGSNYRIYYATSSDGLTWTKYDNTIPTVSDTTSTNGRIPLGTSGKGDSIHTIGPSVMKDGTTYRMWYDGSNGLNIRVYYATSYDGLTWIKTDNTVTFSSDDSSTNGRVSIGTSGKGDSSLARFARVIQDGDDYKMWYIGYDGTNYRGYYATATNNSGTWEEWRPYTSGTNYTTVESGDTHTNWTGTNATVAEGDIGRDVDYFEDEDETVVTNLTKVTSSTNGGYMEATVGTINLSNYDYLTLWVRASQTGAVLRIGMGESAATEQYEDITIDVADTWQKVYWDLSDITGTSRDAITKVRLTNFSTSSNVIYLDNVSGESLLDDGSGNVVTSTPNNYFQYRVIFTTTNPSFAPQLENITLTYSSGFKIQIVDANRVRLYNNSGETKKLKLNIVLGSAAIDLRGTQYALNIAPSSAQIDGGNSTNSIWINKLGTGGNLLKLQTNSVDMMVVDSAGNMTLAGDVAIGGAVVLGATGDQGTIRYNTTDNRIEFSNDGISWMQLGDNTRAITLSAEYSGAVLSGDGSDNVGNMTSDNTGSSSNSMNYYEWSSSAVALNDYDVRVRFTLPSDFVSWGSGGVTLNYATESTSNTNNKLDAYMYLEGSATVDGSSTGNASSSAGVWTSSTIAGSGLDECDTAGESCLIILRMSSLGDNYVRIGDIDITYNRSL